MTSRRRTARLSPRPVIARRSILAAPALFAAPAFFAGVAAALSGCQVYGGQPQATAATPASALAQLADIPVGGGRVFAAQKVVVTQPEPGVVKAFSAICTHQGCAVTEVAGGTINCPCHGSAFRIADGTVASGPATTPLPSAPITVDGATIRLG